MSEISNRALADRIRRLRLPLVLAMVVLATLHHVLLRDRSVELRLTSMLLVYGLAVPVAAWFLLGWLARIAGRAEAANRARLQAGASLERRNQQIEALYTAGRLLSGARNLEQLLEPLTELACRIAQARGGGMVWHGDERREPRIVTWGAVTGTPTRFVTPPGSFECLEKAILASSSDDLTYLPIHTGREVLGLLWLQAADGDAATLQGLNTLVSEIVATWSARRTEGRAVAALGRLGASFRTREDSRQCLNQFLDLVADALGATGACIFRRRERRYLSQARAGREPVPPPVLPDSAHAREIWLEHDGRALYMPAGEDGVLALVFDLHRPVHPQDMQLLRVLGAQAGLLVQIIETWAGLTWNERGRLAAELHDGLSQTLAYLHLHCRRAESALQNDHRESLARTLAEMSQATLDAYEEVRKVVDDLRLVSLPGETVGSFLTRIAHAYEERTGVRITVRAPEGVYWEADVAAQLVRVVQESLTNAARHGHARQIVIDLQCTEEAAVLSVRNDGVGFDPARITEDGHHGLVVMRDRIRGLGGSLAVESSVGTGTTVLRVRLPPSTFEFAHATDQGVVQP